MGGTSTDVARYDGRYDFRYELEVGPARLLTQALAIETVAAGGGSICRFDGGRLTVGPDSAGAVPGPACYGAGGPLTLTDVNLLLGRLDPASFGIPVDLAAAKAALQAVKGSAPLSDNALLQGFLDLAHEAMAGAIREISVRRGYDPSTYTLLAFGGAGGQHACAVADRLGMAEVLVPYEAGILSAAGIGAASIERQAQVQILRPLLEVDVAAVFGELDQEALALLALEGEGGHIHRRSLQLRFQGQSHHLDIEYEPGGISPAEAFRTRYEAVFGHWLADKVVELESARVVAALGQTMPPPLAPGDESYRPEALVKGAAGSMFAWENLRPGAAIDGPAVLAGPHATVVVPKGWQVLLDSGRHAHLRQISRPAPKAGQAEAVRLSLFAHRFEAIAQEMGALLERTSFSVNVKERLDFSCALLDAEGQLVVNAPHIPVHLGSLGVCVRQVVAALDLGPGDVAITNHPGYGGAHLPDVTLIAPVYVEGRRIAYVANRAHHAEIGGRRPGSMPADAQRLSEEGVVIPPYLLARGGLMDRQGIMNLLQKGPFPTRSLAENMADLDASLASIRAGIRGLEQLCHTFGPEEVVTHMQGLRAYAARQMQARLRTFPAGRYTATEFLDDGSPLQVAITLEEGRAHIDFTGTAPTHPGNFNANPAIVTSVVMYVLKLMVEADIPLNEGLMAGISLDLPEGCMLNPVFPENPDLCPAVVGGNVETSQRLTDTLLKALGLMACSQGTMNNLLFGHARLGYYETLGGGTGAGPGFAGAHAVHHHMTNTRMTDPEVLEFRYPVRLERLARRAGSGG
ncbi:MAG: 5-oxoprolinase, partial [Bacteroidetes bacterium]